MKAIYKQILKEQFCFSGAIPKESLIDLDRVKEHIEKDFEELGFFRKYIFKENTLGMKNFTKDYTWMHEYIINGLRAYHNLDVMCLGHDNIRLKKGDFVQLQEDDHDLVCMFFVDCSKTGCCEDCPPATVELMVPTNEQPDRQWNERVCKNYFFVFNGEIPHQITENEGEKPMYISVFKFKIL